ncbi:hypothetical protein HK405_003744, partial [Cladochytrium tenue]
MAGGFSHYQARRFRALFDQFVDANATGSSSASEAEVELDDLDSVDASVDDDYFGGPWGAAAGRGRPSLSDAGGGPARSWSLPVAGRICPRDLHLLMPKLGPAGTLAAAKNYIYAHDSSATGALDFDDFLDFLAAYRTELDASRRHAAAVYEENLANADGYIDGDSQPERESGRAKISRKMRAEARRFLALHPTLDSYLAAQRLDDPALLFSDEDSVTRELRAAGAIPASSPILVRSLTVRVAAARNLACLARPKLRRGVGVRLRALDPLVRVTCGGAGPAQTFAVRGADGASRAEWHQDLHIRVTVPPGDLPDVVAWADRQDVVFELLDLVDDEDGGPRSETLATVSIPLTTVLLSSQRALWRCIPLEPVDSILAAELVALGLDREKGLKDGMIPSLEVSIEDVTVERFAWAKDDSDVAEEEDEVNGHAGMERRQTSKFGPNSKRARSPKKRGGALGYEPRAWTQYGAVVRRLRHAFRRRAFPALAVDEHGAAVPLPALLRPVVPAPGSAAAESPYAAASAVARVPLLAPPLRPARVGHSAALRARASGTAAAAVAAALAADAAAAPVRPPTPGPWGPPRGAAETLGAPVAQPASVLLRRGGSLLEHALLLCDLLLGLGLQAYVAIGKVMQRPYAWVVTITPRTGARDADTDAAADAFLPCRISYYSSVPPIGGGAAADLDPPVIFLRHQFQQLARLRRAQETCLARRIVHWDPLA